MAELRKPKPYIHVTWLAKALANPDCMWQYWFKAHYSYTKHEEMTGDLQRWNREHNELMAARQIEMEEIGFTVHREGAIDFKLEGTTAVVAGKPDIIGNFIVPPLMIEPGKPDPTYTLIVDGKGGIQRESDIWQVKIYLYAIPKCRKDRVRGPLKGEVQYKSNDVRKPVTLADADVEKIVAMIKQLAGPTPLVKKAHRDDCKWCNIGQWDCPEKVLPVASGQSKDF